MRGSLPCRACAVLLATVTASFLFLGDVRAAPPTRHALLIGVGDYTAKNGLPPLVAPRNDAEQLKATLEKKGFDFVADLLVDQDVKNKTAFNEGLQKFLARINANDEVLFYFSGHGFNVPDKGNFFLLPDALGQAKYLETTPAAGESQEEGIRRYQAWVASMAVSENEVLAAVAAKRPRVILIVADACRSYISGSKSGAPLAAGIVRPKETARGTFRSIRPGRAKSPRCAD